MNAIDDLEVERLLRRSWTITSDPSPDDEGDVILRVRELPGVIAIGTPEDVEGLLWDAVRAALRDRLAHGDEIPKPPLIIAAPFALTASDETLTPQEEPATVAVG